MRNQNIKSKISAERLYIIFMAFFAFISMPPYFTWEYSNTLVMLFMKLGLPAIICALGIVLSGSRIKLNEALSALFIIAFGFIQTSRGDNNVNGFIANILIYIAFATFVCQKAEVKSACFSLFYKIFAISLIPGIIVFLLRLVGVDLPHDVIYSTNELKTVIHHYYDHYWGSVIYRAGIGFSFCGMFDEPGTVGTFAGLLLAANMVNIDKQGEGKLKPSWFDIVILIGGILSSSKAFFAILFIIILHYLLNRGHMKAFAGVLALFISLIVLLNANINYSAIKEIQTIINNYMDTGTLALGRAHAGFDEGWKAFLHEAPSFILFGHGIGTSQSVTAFAGSAEIRMLVYEIGFVGIIGEVLWLYLTAKRSSLKHSRIINPSNLLILVFFLSMYQRQNVLSANYIVLLFGGCANILLNELLQNESFQLRRESNEGHYSGGRSRDTVVSAYNGNE